MSHKRLLSGLCLFGANLATLTWAGTGDVGRAAPPSETILLAQNAPASKAKSTSASLLSGPTKRAFKPPKVTPADFLAGGEQLVGVTFRATTPPWPQKRWLVRLEKNWVLLRDIPGKLPTLTTAASRQIVEIATADRKTTWKLSSDGKTFVGPVQKSVAMEEVGIKPSPATKRQVEQFILLSFRRMVTRAIDGVTGAPSPSDVQEVRWVAAKRSEQIARKGFNRSIAELYAALPSVIDTIGAQVKIQDKLIAEYNKSIKDQLDARKRIADRQTMANMSGLAKMFLGGMPQQDVVDIGDGRNIVIDRGVVSPELMSSGLRDIANASMSSAAQEGMLNSVKELVDAKQKAAMEASLGIQMAAIAELRSKFDDLAIREYKLPEITEIPPDEWSRPRKTIADYQSMIDRLNQRCEQDRESLGRENPFSQIDLLFFKSLVPLQVKERIEIWQQEARDAIKLAGELPSDPVFDPDRADLLTTAAELAIRAAEIELGSSRWGDSYHPRAEFAGKVLDLALLYLPEDPSGRIREQKAQTLLLSGRCDEALAIAKEVSAVRAEIPRFRFHLARIECAAGQTDKGLDDLEAAIATLGFADVEEARRRGGDFPQSDPRFRDLTEIKLTIDGGGRRGFGPVPGIRVTNSSRFALTEVYIELRYEVFVGRATFGAQAKTAKHRAWQSVERLEPGESVIVKPGPTGKARFSKAGVLLGTVALDSRQGKSKIYSSK